jgi:hypothetical protein
MNKTKYITLTVIIASLTFLALDINNLTSPTTETRKEVFPKIKNAEKLKNTKKIQKLLNFSKDQIITENYLHKPFSSSRKRAEDKTITEAFTIKPDKKEILKLLNVPVGNKTSVTLILPDGSKKRAFVIARSIYTADAITALGTDDGDIIVEAPQMNFFKGTLENEPNSLVEFSVAENFMSGTIFSEQSTYRFGPDGNPFDGMNTMKPHLVYNVNKVNTDDWKDRELCVFDDAQIANFLDNIENIYPEGEPEDLSQVPPEELPPMVAESQVTYDQVQVAIEGDNELYQDFGNSQSAVFAYYASMINSINVIYQRDVQVDLVISYQRVWTTSSDPYSSNSTSTTLSQLRNYWNSNMSGVTRDTCHLLSGRPVSGGIAYLSALCSGSIGYGLTQVHGSTNTATSSGLWDLVAVAHELGHNHGTHHTHCYSPTIDQCYNGDSSCYTGTRVQSQGTIMSYCHVYGGMFSIDLRFHSRVQTVIRSFVNSRSCLTQVTSGPDLSLKVTGLQTSIQLRWADPEDQGLTTKQVYIVRQTGDYPADKNDGTLVYSGLLQEYQDNSISQDTTYYYRIWGDDGTGTYEDITFNYQGNSYADLGATKLYWQSSTGKVVSWILSLDGTYKSGGVVYSTSLLPKDWVLRGSGDINNDGIADLIWQSTTGSIVFWLLNSDGTYKSGGLVHSAKLRPTDWVIRGIGDIDNDGTADLVWQATDGRIVTWLLNNDGTYKSGGLVHSAKLRPTDWVIRGIGDIDNDGTSDLIWQSTDGRIVTWLLNNDGTYKSGGLIHSAKLRPTDWVIRGIGDIDNDGTSDLIWQSTDGRIVTWLLNNDGTFKSGGQAHSALLPPANWVIRGVSDIDNDGTSDLVWQSTDGRIVTWLLNNDGTFKSGGQVHSALLPPANWVIRTIQ